MSEDRPMRHEEYQAMAEELRLKTQENEKLRKRLDKKRPIDWKPIFRLLKGVALGVITLGVLWMVLMIVGSVVEHHRESERLHPNVSVPKQVHPCYFVRQHEDDADGDVWEKWFIIRSDCDGGCNGYLYVDVGHSNAERVGFDSKIDAWNWAKKYNMEMCK